MEPVICVGRSGTRRSRDPQVLRGLREAFARDRFLLLPSFLPTDLAATFARLVEAGGFELDREGSGYWEKCASGAPAALAGLLNDRSVFEFIGEISGKTVMSFIGRAYRYGVRPDGEGIAWHPDTEDRRAVGISINLSRRPYDGGTWQLRRAATRQGLASVPNPRLGQALLFDLAEDVEHRMAPVSAGVKVAFAGWFRYARAPGFSDWLRSGPLESQP